MQSLGGVTGGGSCWTRVSPWGNLGCFSFSSSQRGKSAPISPSPNSTEDFPQSMGAPVTSKLLVLYGSVTMVVNDLRHSFLDQQDPNLNQIKCGLHRLSIPVIPSHVQRWLIQPTRVSHNKSICAAVPTFIFLSLLPLCYQVLFVEMDIK